MNQFSLTIMAIYNTNDMYQCVWCPMMNQNARSFEYQMTDNVVLNKRTCMRINDNSFILPKKNVCLKTKKDKIKEKETNIQKKNNHNNKISFILTRFLMARNKS